MLGSRRRCSWLGRGATFWFSTLGNDETASRLTRMASWAKTGSRRTPSQMDVDWNYTQNFGVSHGLNLQLAFDVFNLLDLQTGYNF